jgi:hypothetical protein
MALLLMVVSDGSAGVPGGTFLVRNPVNFELAARTLRAAKGPMLSEFNRYFRHPVRLPVLITKDSGGEFQATSINVSHCGLGVQMPGLNMIAVTDVVRARLAMPGSTWFDTKGKVVWTDPRGRAGIQCQAISPRDLQKLEEIVGTHSGRSKAARVIR